MQESKNNCNKKMNCKEQQTEYLLLYNIIRTAHNNHDLEDSLKVILEYIIKFMKFEGGGIYLIDDKERIAKIVSHIGLPQDFINFEDNKNIDQNPCNSVFIKGKPIFTEKYNELNPENYKKWGFLSVASIPLSSNNKIIGALNITSKEKYQFSNNEKELLEIIAQELGSIIIKIKTEKLLKENNQKLEIVFESLQEFLFVFNSEGKILYTNPRVTSRLKYTKEEILKMNITDFHPIELYEEAKLILTKIVNNQEDISNLPLLSKDSEIIPVETTISRGIWDNENVFIKICRDVTKHQKIEDELKKKEKDIAELKILESELKYRMILESTNDGYFEVNLHGDFNFVNARFCEIFDYTSKEIIDQNFKNFFNSDDNRDKIFKSFYNVYETNLPNNNIPLKISLKNGITKIIETSVFLKYNSKGKKIGFCGVVKDITSRIEAEEKLRESERKYRNIIENTRDAIIIVGFDGKFKYISPQLSKILKRTDIQIGDRFIDYIYREDLDYILKFYQKAINKKEIFMENDIDFRAITGEGKIKWLTSSTHNYINDSGEIEGFITLLRDVNDQKKTELKLEKTEKKYEKIIKNIKDAIIITDFSGKFIYASPQFYDIIGKDKATTKKINSLEIHPDDREYLLKNFTFAANQKSVQIDSTLEYRIQHEKGHYVWISSTTKDYYDENDNIIGFISTLRDITQEKEAEEKLKRSEIELKKRYKELNCLYGISKLVENPLISLNDIINGTLYIIPFAWDYSNDIHVRIIYRNNEYTTRNFSKTSKNICSKFDIEDENLEIQVYTSAERNFLKEEIALLNEIGLRLKNIIIQKESEKKLKESEGKYRSILENIKEAYYEVDLKGNFTFFNDTLSEFLNYPKNKLLGLNYRDYMDEENSKIVFNAFNQVYHTKFGNDKIEYEVIKKNGEKVNFQTSAYLIYDEKSNIKGFYGLIRDITERKKNEALKEEFNKKLKEEVKIKTKELNEALTQQKYYVEQIMKASKFKSEFMSTMSHELRTPLNSIMGFSELLLLNEYNNLNDEQIDFLTDIMNSSEILLEMINHLLDISKIEAGKLTLNKELISLKPIIEQVNSMIKPLYTKKGLDFKVNGLKNDVMIYVDPIRLKEILFNLLSNAIKFTLDGEIGLIVEETNEDFIFKIRDTGIGIARKDFNLIFKDFKRVNSPIVNSIPGSGLGLSLTKRIINLHGGEINFFSILGKGTTFTFSIPKSE